MLNERGVIIDDGVFVKLAENHFLINTTSGGVAHISEMLEDWLQCEWPNLQVLINDVTTQWANFTVAGPRARDLISKLGTDINLSAEALPHMAMAEGNLMGINVRIVRVSFSGELSYEINLPAGFAEAFMEAVLQAGEEFDICPYGIETLLLLRTEKGYLHIGSETDGSSVPDDVGWDDVARNKAADYIGKRSLDLEANREPQRQQLVGLQALQEQQPIRPGAHLRITNESRTGIGSDGWVTSACYSPHLETHIALAVLRGGRQRQGEIVEVLDEAHRYQARVVAPVFFDPANERLSR
jgi:sarcosine oxidase subunit alpha